MGRRKVQVVWNEDGTKKRCETCEHFKYPEEFHYKTKCEECYQDYQAEYRAKNREVLAERKRLQRAARKGEEAKRKYRNLQVLTETLETALNEGSCKTCSEDENVALRFVVENSEKHTTEQYQLEGAIASFKHEQEFSLFCLNCLAKQKHLLPSF